MSIEGLKFYPGDGATAEELLLLAAEFHRAAEALSSLGRRKAPLSLWPYRFAAIHAVELYLDSYLIGQGRKPAEIRRLRHDLAERTDMAVKLGLSLKKLTQAHLCRLTETREYLIVRYGADQSGALSPPNRLKATLDDVARKVEAVVRPR